MDGVVQDVWVDTTCEDIGDDSSKTIHAWDNWLGYGVVKVTDQLSEVIGGTITKEDGLYILLSPEKDKYSHNIVLGQFPNHELANAHCQMLLELQGEGS